MKLKKLELLGFKSFGEKVTVSFDGFLIALVGPNGCGKSNIVDAILWALGEQSARSLRAEKMHDLLFAGADGLPPFNLAEVSLTFSQVPQLFPGCPEEITVTRRLYRDGNMHYFLNKKEVRLKDIQEIFLGTGIGKNAFFVFEQGKLDEIIHLTPEKRRLLFEESAGISRFMEKKKEALKQLAEVDTNVVRLSDIALEREKRVRALQKVAAKAKEYKETKERLEQLERALLLFKYRENEEKKLQNKLQLAALESKLQEQESSIDLLKQESALFEENREEGEKKFQSLQEAHYKIESTLQLVRAELQRTERDLQEIDEKEIKENEEEKHLKVALDSNQRALLVCESLLQEERLLWEKAAEQCREKEEVLQQVESAMQSQLLEEKRVQKEYLFQIEERVRVEKKFQEKVLKTETVEQLIQNHKKNSIKRKEALLLLREKEGPQRVQVEKFSLAIDREKVVLKNLVEESARYKEQEKRALKAKQKIEMDLSRLLMRLKALQQLQKDQVGFSEGTKEILKEAKNPKSPFHQKVEPLYPYLLPQEGKEQRVAHALSAYLETLVVYEEATFFLLLDFAREKQLIDFSLVLIDKESCIDFPPLKNLHYFPTLQEGLKKKGGKTSTIICEDGYFVDPFGVVFASKERALEKNHLLRLAEIAKIEKEVKSSEEANRVIAQEIQESVQKSREVIVQEKRIEESLRQKEMALLKENFYLQTLCEEIKKSDCEIVNLEKEAQKLEEQLQSHSIEKEAAELLLKENDRKDDLLKRALVKIEEECGEKKRALERVRAQFKECETQKANLQLKQQKTVEKGQLLSLKTEETKRGLQRVQGSLFLREKQKKALIEKKSDQEIALGNLSLEREKNQASFTEEKLFLEKLRVEKREREKRLEEAKLKLKKLEREHHSLLHYCAEQENGARTIVQEAEKRGFSLEPEQDLSFEISIKEAEETVVRWKYELEKDSVNLASIEEYALEELSFTKLSLQLKDLKESQEELALMVSKIEKESKKALKSTFEAIRANFQKNFRTLFHGGHADLVLTDKENILESGVEIMAQPPGKKMRFLSLLSGGEKCLTAVALLFAFFEVKRPPFCILDEVDAPLDEANVERLTALLQQFVPATQFILVTHNKQSMKVADLLIGVSMEKKGVSTLIALEFDKKTAIAK